LPDQVNKKQGCVDVETFIPLSVPNLKGNEQKYVNEAISQEWVSTGGGYITKLEKMIADFVHMPDAVACQSGTAALHLALLCCGVQPGDEVIVPALTFVAAVNPVRYANAEPVFMDCNDTLCIDMDKLEEFLRNECVLDKDGTARNRKTGKRISAVIIVHVFGNMADMDKLMALKKEYGFAVIEDATEALGSYQKEGAYAGRHAGTIGDIGAYSFNGNKIITTGGGGMLVSGRQDLLDHARYLSTQAKNDTLYFKHNEIGYNYRMTNLQAALGVGQMERLEEFISIKESNYELYRAQGIELLPFRDDIRSNHWFYSFITSNRDELIAYLQAKGIQSRPVWWLINELPPYAGNEAYKVEKANYYWKHIVNIPCSTNLLPEDVCRVANEITRFRR
jgi:perosamine synthetase